MTILISRELPLFIVERPDISWASYIHPSQKSWSFEYAESLCVQFWASLHIMRLNRTSQWKVMTIWNSRELPLFIVESLDISWASYIHPSLKLWPFENVESFSGQFWASLHIMHLNQTSEWKFMTLNFGDHPLFIVERPDISWASYIHPSQKSWPFEYAESFCVQFWASLHIIRLNRTSEWKVMTIRNSRELPLFIVESLDISWASYIPPSLELWSFEYAESFCVQFRASLHIMRLNRTSELNVITIWISPELPLFIVERPDISWALHIHLSKKLWLFEFAESFCVQFRAS